MNILRKKKEDFKKRRKLNRGKAVPTKAKTRKRKKRKQKITLKMLQEGKVKKIHFPSYAKRCREALALAERLDEMSRVDYEKLRNAVFSSPLSR